VVAAGNDARIWRKMVHTARTKPGLAAVARAGLTAIVLAAGTWPALAADDSVLAHFVGEWIGRGTYRASAGADPERLYCKITNRLVEDGQVLEQRGRCANPAQSSALRGRIAAVGGGRYEGMLQSLTSDGAATLKGTGSNGRLDLTAEFVDRLTHRPAESAISLVANDDGYHLVTRNTTRNKTPFVATDVVFTHD
jgi:hypothetical protein